MSLNNLRITSTNGQIGIETTRGSYSMQTIKGQQTINTTSTKMSIKGEEPKVIIDSYECRAEVGLKNNIDLLAEGAQLGKQAAINAIARIVEDGNRMAMIQKKMPPAFTEIAEKNARPPQYGFNIDFLPKSRPKIDVVGNLDIDWQIGETEINHTQGRTEVDYNAGKVNIYMQKYPELNIEYVDRRV